MNFLNNYYTVQLADIKQTQQSLREGEIFLRRGHKPAVSFAPPGVYPSQYLRVGRVFSPLKVCGSPMLFEQRNSIHIIEAVDYVIVFMDFVKEVDNLKRIRKRKSRKEKEIFPRLSYCISEVCIEMDRIVQFVTELTTEGELGLPKPIDVFKQSYFCKKLYKEQGVLGLCNKLSKDIFNQLVNYKGKLENNTREYYEKVYVLLIWVRNMLQVYT